MKLAILTDIHGNSPALKAVLTEVDQLSVDHIYCLGDMIGIGPNTNEVLDILLSRSNITLLTGNHDEAVLTLYKGEPYPKSHEPVRSHHQWIADRIDPAFVKMLEKFPRIATRTIEDVKVYFTHYRIRPNRMEAHISEDPFHSIIDPNLENMEKLFQNFSEDLICFGHHHPLHYFKGEKNTFLNPGALGCSPDNLAPYAIVTLKNSQFNIEIKKAEYNKQPFLESYEKLNVPEKDFILRVFHSQK